MPRAKNSARPVAAKRIRLLISTRKGLWSLVSDLARNAWKLSGPLFHGHIVHHAVVDPRDSRTMLAAARTGHLGPTVFRSGDGGRTWKESSRPPAFAEGSGRVVNHTFWLASGHPTEQGTWYAGTSPQGLFRSVDGGVRWEGVSGFNAHPQRKAWCGGDQDGTPDGPKLHSILVDPRDPKHLYMAMSSGGVFESLDAGADWRPLNRGVRADFLPEPNPEYGHDPHCMRFAAGHPDRLYQQNHCGIFRIDRPNVEWVDIGVAMPKSVGYVGFPMVTHPRDGWHKRLAADVAGWPPGGVSLAGWRTRLEATGSGSAQGAGVVDGQAPGHDRGFA